MTEISIAEIQSLTGASLLEFGTSWCRYCQNSQPIIATALKDYPKVTHLQIEDGKGQHLGRLYSVKLWPTLIFLSHGKEVSRSVRPTNVREIADLLDQITQ